MTAHCLMLGIVAGLLGLFYHNCLKGEDMIFHKFYKRVLEPWGKSSHPVLSFIAYPLGYCIYCCTTWIGFIITALYFTTYYSAPAWQEIVIGAFAVMGVSHLVVVAACRWLINGHPDWDKSANQTFYVDTVREFNRVTIGPEVYLAPKDWEDIVRHLEGSNARAEELAVKIREQLEEADYNG